MKVLGIIMARDERRTILQALQTFKYQSIPYIAILDNPTGEIRWITRDALDVYETPYQKAAHVYRWEEILNLLKWAVDRPREYDWVWRIDADELWPTNVKQEIEKAEAQGCNAVNFSVINHSPSKLCLGENEDFVEACPPAIKGDAFYSEKPAIKYQRAWKPKGEWEFQGGGHQVGRKDLKVFNSNVCFDHYPAVDKFSLERKRHRIYLHKEKGYGWHTQYDNVKPVVKAVLAKRLHSFYHVAKLTEWASVYREQMDVFNRSGIPGGKQLQIGYVGDKSDEILIPDQTKYEGAVSNYEFPTLHLLWEWCREHPEDYVLYFHTKGVSKGVLHSYSVAWRRYLMWGCIERWRECVTALDEGYDMAGVEWTDIPSLDKYGVTNPDPYGFWGGNFFWANARYISTLQDPLSLDTTNRYYAEAWIGLGPRPPIIKCLYDTRAAFEGRRGWEFLGWGRQNYADGRPWVDPNKPKEHVELVKKQIPAHRLRGGLATPFLPVINRRK